VVKVKLGKAARKLIARKRTPKTTAATSTSGKAQVTPKARCNKAPLRWRSRHPME
jgi:hypothetical protein